MYQQWYIKYFTHCVSQSLWQWYFWCSQLYWPCSILLQYLSNNPHITYMCMYLFVQTTYLLLHFLFLSTYLLIPSFLYRLWTLLMAPFGHPVPHVKCSPDDALPTVPLFSLSSQSPLLPFTVLLSWPLLSSYVSIQYHWCIYDQLHDFLLLQQ